MLQIAEDVRAFISQVVEKSSGYDVYLGGGYLRDLYANKLNGTSIKSKDVDIFLVPCSEWAGGREIPTIPKTYISYHTPSSKIPDMKQRGIDSVIGLYKRGLSTPDIQFIIYEKHITMDELAADMDCNINQIMYDPLSNSYSYTKDFEEGHSNKEISLHHNFNKVRQFLRLRRMKSKFPQYEVKFNSYMTQQVFVEVSELQEVLELKEKRGVVGSFIEE